MASYTPNYNLIKPAQDDFYNVDEFNENADKIDAGMKGIVADTAAKYAPIVHAHENATAAKAGFMSAADKAKLDGVSGTYAVKSRTLTVTLLATAWTGSDVPYQVTVTVPGMTAAMNGAASVAQESSYEERREARKAALSVATQGTNTVVVRADLARPEIDIPIDVLMVG